MLTEASSKTLIGRPGLVSQRQILLMILSNLDP
jgi:hypothetical protein